MLAALTLESLGSRLETDQRATRGVEHAFELPVRLNAGTEDDDRTATWHEEEEPA